MSSTASMAFAKVPLAAAWDETAVMRALRVDLRAAGLASAYTIPGQYIKVRAGGGESLFALCSAPAPDGSAELLVKRGGGVAEALCALGAGDSVEISAPSGKGFPLESARGRPLFLLAAGSGVGPLRAVIQHALAHRDAFGELSLLYGQRQEGDFAFLHEHVEWERVGVRVTRVCSRPGDGFRGARGYVQDVLVAQRPEVREAVAFLSGPKAMVLAATESFATIGMPKERVFLNF